MQITLCRARSHLRLPAAMLLPIVLTSCSQPRPPADGQRPPTGPVAMHHGLSLVEPPEPSLIVAGETIYVPAYSSIFISDRADRFDLAITVAVRNTDRTQPIIVTTVRYLGQDGQPVRDYLEKPLRIAPLASASFFVAESDSKAGALASFLVEWIAQQPVTSPVVETTMVGIGGTQGVSFVCQGRVIASRAVPRARVPE